MKKIFLEITQNAMLEAKLLKTLKEKSELFSSLQQPTSLRWQSKHLFILIKIKTQFFSCTTYILRAYSHIWLTAVALHIVHSTAFPSSQNVLLDSAGLQEREDKKAQSQDETERDWRRGHMVRDNGRE